MSATMTTSGGGVMPSSTPAAGCSSSSDGAAVPGEQRPGKHAAATATMKRSNNSPKWGGWRAALGCTPRSLASYRISLGVMLLTELALRFQYLHAFYSDEGTLPTHLLRPQIDALYSTICLHCRSGSLAYQQFLLSLQCLSALSLTLGYKTRLAAVLSWFLYLSLTLRNTWLAFILDRYFHYLTFYAMFLGPAMGECWSLDKWLGERRRRQRQTTRADAEESSSSQENGSSTDDNNAVAVANDDDSIIVSPATMALKLQIMWIYLDAGGGKFLDPLGGWTYGADPLPALDTYARHTLGARYLYALLGPFGLRLLTPTVVWVELGAAPLAMVGSWFGRSAMVWGAVLTVWALHLGIAGTVRNTVLLSLVANVAWCVYLPLVASPSPDGGGGDSGGSSSSPASSATGGMPSAAVGVVGVGGASAKPAAAPSGRGGGGSSGLFSRARRHLPSLLVISVFVAGSVWFEVFSAQCDQSMKHIWSTLLHNRWNVFVGAEEYVTWEIAPGRLSDNSIVDVWSKSSKVQWDMPGSGAPCTSTSRAGRWRSFPYLADFASAEEGEEGYEEGMVLWEYLCKEWNEENNGVIDNTAAKEGGGTSSNSNGGRRLLRYNFFMLQADVLPEMGFSETRKRLIRSHECGSGSGSGGGHHASHSNAVPSETTAEPLSSSGKDGEL